MGMVTVAGALGGVAGAFVFVFGLFTVGAGSSIPNGANGFGLPSFPSGIRTMLESRKLANTLLEKIASSNFILLTLKSRVKKSRASKELLSKTAVFGAEVLGATEGGEEEISVALGGDVFIKKT